MTYAYLNQALWLSAQSFETIEYLLDKTSKPELNSTLTIWGTDPISQEGLEDLKNFILKIGKNRIFVDTAYDLNFAYQPLETI